MQQRQSVNTCNHSGFLSDGEKEYQLGHDLYLHRPVRFSGWRILSEAIRLALYIPIWKPSFIQPWVYVLLGWSAASLTMTSGHFLYIWMLGPC